MYYASVTLDQRESASSCLRLSAIRTTRRLTDLKAPQDKYVLSVERKSTVAQWVIVHKGRETERGRMRDYYFLPMQ